MTPAAVAALLPCHLSQTHSSFSSVRHYIQTVHNHFIEREYTDPIVADCPFPAQKKEVGCAECECIVLTLLLIVFSSVKRFAAACSTSPSLQLRPAILPSRACAGFVPRGDTSDILQALAALVLAARADLDASTSGADLADSGSGGGGAARTLVLRAQCEEGYLKGAEAAVNGVVAVLA